MATTSYPLPEDPLVAEIVERFPAELRFEFEERAAIMEFDADLERAHAECLALIEVLRQDPSLLSGVVVVTFQRDEMTDWLLVSNQAAAQSAIDQLGGAIVEIRSPLDILHEQFNGVALLTPLE